MVLELFSLSRTIDKNLHQPFKRRIKPHLPPAGIIINSTYSPRWQDKG